MNKEEIKLRMLLCELKEREYLEAGNTKTANRYHNELLKWDKLLEELNSTLLEERNNYKRAYLKLQSQIDTITDMLNNATKLSIDDTFKRNLLFIAKVTDEE